MKSTLNFILLLVCASWIIVGCNTEPPQDELNSFSKDALVITDPSWSSNERAFFNLMSSGRVSSRSQTSLLTHPTVIRTYNELVHLNETNNFIEDFVETAGVPYWHEARINTDYSANEELLIMPLVNNGDAEIKGLIVATNQLASDGAFHVTAIPKNKILDALGAGYCEYLLYAQWFFQFSSDLLDISYQEAEDLYCDLIDDCDLSIPNASSSIPPTCTWMAIQVCTNDNGGWRYGQQYVPSNSNFNGSGSLFDGDHDNDGIPDQFDPGWMSFNFFHPRGDHDFDGIPNDQDDDWYDKMEEYDPEYIDKYTDDGDHDGDGIINTEDPDWLDFIGERDDRNFALLDDYGDHDNDGVLNHEDQDWYEFIARFGDFLDAYFDEDHPDSYWTENWRDDYWNYDWDTFWDQFIDDYDRGDYWDEYDVWDFYDWWYDDDDTLDDWDGGPVRDREEVPCCALDYDPCSSGVKEQTIETRSEDCTWYLVEYCGEGIGENWWDSFLNWEVCENCGDQDHDTEFRMARFNDVIKERGLNIETADLMAACPQCDVFNPNFSQQAVDAYWELRRNYLDGLIGSDRLESIDLRTWLEASADCHYDGGMSGCAYETYRDNVYLREVPEFNEELSVSEKDWLVDNPTRMDALYGWARDFIGDREVSLNAQRSFIKLGEQGLLEGPYSESDLAQIESILGQAPPDDECPDCTMHERVLHEYFYLHDKRNVDTNGEHCSQHCGAVLFLRAHANVFLGNVHTALDICGLVPGLGEPCDGVNGILYLAEGDYTNAGFSFAATVPFLGWTATGAKYSIVALKTAAGYKNLRLSIGATGIIEFSHKSSFRSIVGVVDPDNHAHHLLSWNKRYDKVIQKAAEAYEVPFHMNAPLNGLEVAAWRNTRHDAYDIRVQKGLNAIFEKYNRDLFNVDPNLIAEELLIFQDYLKDVINSNPNLKIDDIIFQYVPQ